MRPERPAGPEGRIAASWDANAGAWTAAVRGRALPSRRLGTDAAVVEAVRATGARRVLDLGCGEGWLARALAAEGLDVTGTDGAAALVDAARSAPHAGPGPAPRYLVRSYEALVEDGVPGRPYDAVVASFALLGADLDGLLRAVHAATRPGGSLVVQTLHPLGVKGSYAEGWREETFAGLGAGWAPMPWYFRPFGAWVALLARTGWALTAVAEPLHPETARPLSLVLTGVKGEG